MTDLGSAFARAMAYTHAPWWQRLLHKPAATILYPTLLRLPQCVPLALQVPAHTFFGEEMLVVLPEGSACQIFCQGAIEEDVTSFLLTHVKEGMTFIDVGANVGYFALLAATLVGPSGQVHAFEPAQATCDILRHNTRRHGNITVQQKALWSRRTTLLFHEYGRRYSALNSVRHHRLVRESGLAPTRAYDVEATTLDEYCTDRALAPDFIKIDAETAEPQILRGSTHTLARHRPLIALEVWDDPARNSRDDITFLLNHGYETFEYHAGATIPHRLRDSYGYANLLFAHPRKAQGLAPAHAAAEAPATETAIHDSGS
jgi:FkbM family methyltransferase